MEEHLLISVFDELQGTQDGFQVLFRRAYIFDHEEAVDVCVVGELI